MNQRIKRLPFFLIPTGFSLSILFFVVSCHRTTGHLFPAKTSVKSKLTETANWADKRRQGVDFIAIGTSPVATTANWRLDIDFSKQMLFQPLDGPELLMPMPKPQPTGKGLGVLLDARSAPAYASTSRRGGATRSSAAKLNRLKVSIEPISCRDPLTNRDYAYTVRIDANGKRYLGCGAFIKGSDRLNGEWLIETFRGQRLRPDQFADKALPFVEIDLSSNKLTGSTGWNKIRGGIHADGDHLTIDPKTTTRKTSVGTFEADFLDALRQSSLFRIGKDRLTLLVNGQYVMTLKRK